MSGAYWRYHNGCLSEAPANATKNLAAEAASRARDAAVRTRGGIGSNTVVRMR